MLKDIDVQLFEALDVLKRGGVVAYPTEAVYGLGCDPFHADAVTRILQLKQRSISKGFILIAAHWGQVESLVQPINPQALARVFSSWPGPTTWVFPAQPHVPYWIIGDHPSIAIRVTDHPIAAKLCTLFSGPIISTSANIQGFSPIRDHRTIAFTFDNKVDFVVCGKLGNNNKPTQIRDAISGEILRA